MQYAFSKNHFLLQAMYLTKSLQYQSCPIGSEILTKRNATLNHEFFENFDFVIPDLRVRNKVIHRLIVIVFA